jgi:hypothetical protein
MSAILLLIGVACIAAAIFGPRLRVRGNEIPFLQSRAGQLGLGGIGALALLLGLLLPSRSASRDGVRASNAGTSTAWANEVGGLFADQRRCSALGRKDDADLVELEVRSTVKESLWVRGHSPQTQDNMALGELESLSRSSGLASGQGVAGRELCK